MDVAELWYNGDLVGYRFTIGSKRYDVELNTVHALGVSIFGSNKVHLKARGKLLVSDLELAKRKRVKDISNDPTKLKEILDSLIPVSKG